MTTVTEAAQRIAARFKACSGKNPPCSTTCQCMVEAAKTLGVKWPEVKRVAPEPQRDENGNLPCPFCGGKVDPEGWMLMDPDRSEVRGPECDNCGATASSIEDWNKRV